MSLSAKAAKRPYDSSRRQAMAADTRLAVIAAATRLFSERGWETSVRDIAREAGVAVETVYKAVGSKRELLKVAIDVGLVGDDEPIALAERAQFAALGEGDRRTRFGRVAALVADQYSRVAALHRALDQGAEADAELADLQGVVHHQQNLTVAEGLALVLSQRPEPELVAGVQAVSSPEVYLHLIRKTRWSSEQYQQWLAQTLFQLVSHIPEEST